MTFIHEGALRFVFTFCPLSKRGYCFSEDFTGRKEHYYKILKQMLKYEHLNTFCFILNSILNISKVTREEKKNAF